VASAQQAAAMEGASRPRPVPKKQAIKPIATATLDPVSVAQKAKPITNQAASASPKFATKERGESGGEYTIKKGDSLSVIAQQNGTTVAEIARLNGIKDINFIRAGDSIKLPGNDADDAPIDKQQSGVVNGRLRDTSGINVSRDFSGAVEPATPELYAFPGSTAWKGANAIKGVRDGINTARAAYAARIAASAAKPLTREAQRDATRLGSTIARSPHKFRR